MYELRERPRRPAIPPVLHALAAVLLVERAVLAGGLPWLDGAAGRAALGAAAALVLLAAVLRALGRADAAPLALLLAASAAAALVASSAAVARGAAAARALRETPVSGWEFELVADPSAVEGGYRGRATARDGLGHAADVWLTLPTRVPRTSLVRCVGRFRDLGDDEWSTSSRMQGVWGSVRAFRVDVVRQPLGLAPAIESLRGRACSSMEPESSPARALLAGCSCGWRDGLDAFGLRDLFARCGIAHLVAVSGGHMSVLMALLSALLGTMRAGRRARTVVVLAACGAFVLFCGAPPSAVRAFLMTSTALLGNLRGRRSHGVSGMATMGLAMLLLDPPVAGQLGFVLSVTSVGALCLFGPYATYACATLVGEPAVPRHCPRAVRRRVLGAWRAITSSVATSLLVMVATLPLVAGAFGELSLVGPLANALLSAPLSALVAVGIACAALWWAPPAQALALSAADLVGSLVLAVARVLAALPLASVTVPFGVPASAAVACGLYVALLAVWPAVSRRRVASGLAVAATLVCVLLVRWRFLAPARICVLDVGQGDAILVQDGAAAVLVDAGPDDSVSRALARNHVLHLDAVVVTHLHADHYAGLASIAGKLGDPRVIVARGVAAHIPPEVAEAAAAGGDGLDEVSYGDVIRVGGFSLRVVSPHDEVDGSQNAHSIELVARYGRGGGRLVALLTGDAEEQELDGLLGRGDVGDIDLLKVGHHGSEVSIRADQACVLDPEVSVASAGRGNSYGHPTDACVRALKEAGSLFLCTMDVGDVDVRPGADGPRVLCDTPVADGP